MKKVIALFCTALMMSVLLCGCDEKEKNKVSDELATLATEVKENIDTMIDDGTVSDGDGYIDEDRDATVRYDATVDDTEALDPTNDNTEADSIFDADPADTM